jgi:hypothetical protein
MHAAVEADWAGNTAGGTILYKTKYQGTMALSTTAACNVG